MICPNCGFDAGNSKFCLQCGTKLEPVVDLEPVTEQPTEVAVCEEQVKEVAEIPAEPIQNMTLPVEESDNKWPKAAKIIVGVLSGCCVGMLVLAIALGVSGSMSLTKVRREKDQLSNELNSAMELVDGLNSENEELNEALSASSESISQVEAAYQELEKAYGELGESNEAALKKVEELEEERDYYVNYAHNYDLICQAVSEGELGKGSSKFYASTGLIVMKKTDAAQKIQVTLNIKGSSNVYYNSRSILVTRGEWGKSDNKGHLPLTITPVGAGVDVYTFTNDRNSDTFKIIVIVTD